MTIPSDYTSFSIEPDKYAEYRPDYPAQLFSFLSDLCTQHITAWDCCCGNGQVSKKLRNYFDFVIANDISEKYIGLTSSFNNVSYWVSSAESPGIKSESIDLVCIAQALHWLDLTKFYNEVRRILKKSGIIAAWCYSKLEILHETEITKLVAKIHTLINTPPLFNPKRIIVIASPTLLHIFAR